MRLRTIRAAQNILKLGFQENDVFSIIAGNSENVAPIVFASMSIGCPLNTLDPSFGTFEVAHMFKMAKPKLIFCDLNKLEVVLNSLEQLNMNAMIFTFGESTEHSQNIDELLNETGDEQEFV